jgi:hypothetical protein
VEVRSFVKIALRRGGLRPPLFPSSSNQSRTPERVRLIPDDRIPIDFNRSRGKHHAKASRLRVWKQIAAGTRLAQQRTARVLWERCGIRRLLWIALENRLGTLEPELSRLDYRVKEKGAISRAL